MDRQADNDMQLHHPKLQQKPVFRFAAFWLAIATTLLTGCDGCRQANDDDPQKLKELPRSEFTVPPPQVLPTDRTVISGGLKPGHWFTASQAVKSNLGDRRGQLRSTLAMPIIDADGMETGRSTISSLDSLRPVVLPKGQQRNFDYRLLTPLPAGTDQGTFRLRSRLEVAGQVASFEGNSLPFTIMGEQEYFFVILTERDTRFTRLSVSDWVTPLVIPADFRRAQSNYRIVVPSTDSLLGLPETMLDWTATGFVLWDNMESEKLTPLQMTALGDWVHFGGTLIVNGADAAESLDRSIMSQWLPMKPTGNLEMDPEAAAALLTNWSVETDLSVEKQIALANDQSARIVLEGIPHELSVVLPDSGDLILTRRVGRGRIVQARFDLTSDWITGWDSYDSFFNNVILSRPHRKFVQEPSEFGELGYRHSYLDLNTSQAKATFNTRFRLVARDGRFANPQIAKTEQDVSATGVIGGRVAGTPVEEPPSAQVSQNASLPGVSGDVDSLQSPLIDSSFRTTAFSGIGGWNDNSDVMQQSRKTLREQSGIEIPSMDLVAKSLAIYLFVLVPLNFFIFRLLGKLEYAWFSVPLIAILGAVAVARTARLDIGFARSQTELSLLEMQPGYARGHLSRVVAIYNSLSTPYELAFDTIDGVAAPIGILKENKNSAVTFQSSFNEGPGLTGLSVDSNQVGTIHAEQMVEMGGGIMLRETSPDSPVRLVNETNHDLQDVYVVRRNAGGTMEASVVGAIPSQGEAVLRFVSGDEFLVPDSLPLGSAGLIRSLIRSMPIKQDEMRMVARIDDKLPGMQIMPSATQSIGQTVVFVTLQYPPFKRPQVDLNLVTDFRKVQTILPGDEPEKQNPTPQQNSVTQEQSP